MGIPAMKPEPPVVVQQVPSQHSHVSPFLSFPLLANGAGTCRRDVPVTRILVIFAAKQEPNGPQNTSARSNAQALSSKKCTPARAAERGKAQRIVNLVDKNVNRIESSGFTSARRLTGSPSLL